MNKKEKQQIKYAKSLYDNGADFLKRPYFSVSALITKDGLVLLGRRKNTYASGCWHIPGGHVNPGELIKDALVREIFEETRIKRKDFKIKELAGIRETLKQPHHIELIYRVELLRNIKKIEIGEPEKCEGWKWFNIKKLPSPFIPAMASVWKKIKKKYGLPNSRPKNCRCEL